MRKRRFMMLLAATLMLAATVFPTVTALAATDISTLAVATSKQLTITTAAGAVINPDASGHYTNVPKDAKLLVHYAFTLPDDNGLNQTDPSYVEYDYAAGDYLDVQLPYAVSFSAPSDDWSVLDKDGLQLGTLSINTSGLARITFTKYVEEHSSIAGWFSLEGSFKDGIFDAGDPVQIDIVFAGTTVTIGFKEEGEPLSISADKNGIYDATNNWITWTVTVTPNKEVKGVSVVDSFSNNQTYVPGSFKMGEDTVDDSALTITATTITYSGLTLNAATTFTYRTTPTGTAFTAETGSNENTSFTNNVNVYKDDIPYANDNATVSLNWVQKTGSVVGTSLADSRLIRWTVTVDSDGYDITGCTLTDTIPKDLNLFVDGTRPVRFGGTTLTEAATGGTPDTYTYATETDGSHTMTLYLGSVTNSGSLTFYTRVTDEAFYKINGTTTLTNSIAMDWTENHSGTPTDSYGVNVGLGLISKSAGSTVNYNDDTTNPITWTVQINRNRIDITNAVFSDTILAGQEYVADSFTINDTGGTFSYDPGTKTLQYDFGLGRTISTAYTITFQTRITDYTQLYVNQSNTSGYNQYRHAFRRRYGHCQCDFYRPSALQQPGGRQNGADRL